MGWIKTVDITESKMKERYKGEKHKRNRRRRGRRRHGRYGKVTKQIRNKE